MAEMKPQFGPGGSTPQATGGSGSAPAATPPPGAGSAGTGDCGCGGAQAGGAGAGPSAGAMASSGDSSPGVSPGAGAGIAAWLNNKRITALWSINENRNSWAFVDGVGWKKLANNSDSAIVALTMLSAHARDKSSVVNYREEGDGMIREMYVW